MDSHARGPRLRLVCINDVYTLTNLPRLRVLVRQEATRDPADVLLVTLAGDFLAPSLLSSLDGGRGMVDCLNAVPVTHVTFGNHEDDLSPEDLRARIAQFQGTWLATNLSDFEPVLPRCQILEVGAAGGRRVRVGLVGVVMEDPAIYRGAPFGGATVLPANASALRAALYLRQQEGCSCVIPLTHQEVAQDRALAEAQHDPPFPVIVGGHEHTVMLEQVGPTWIVKAGSDAVNAVVVELSWGAEAREGEQPEVSVRLEALAKFDEDPALRAVVDGHLRALQALEEATLLRLGPGQTLSSVGTRSRQTSLGALLCSQLRDAFGAEGCIFNGGGIRASRTYERRFTYGDLKAEVPFDNEIVVVDVPGQVLREAIAASRSHAPADSGGFLQVDDGMVVDEPGHRLVSIGGAPLDEQRDYAIALVRNLFEGMDHIEPLVRFARANPSRVPHAGSGREIKVALVEAFSRELWEQLGDFDTIDLNRDGLLDAQEIALAVTRATAEPASSLTVELLMKALDQDRDRLISRQDLAASLPRPARRG